MLSKGEKIFTLITNLLTFALCLLVVVPFGKTGISEGELTFKVLLAPIAILVLFILNSYVKYVVNADNIGIIHIVQSFILEFGTCAKSKPKKLVFNKSGLFISVSFIDFSYL